MQITDILAQTGGLHSIARELGLSEQQAASGAAALVPAILGGFKKQTQSHPEGLQGLGGMLDQFGGGGLLDQVLSPQPTDPSAGNGVLGQIFGSKDVSRAVAQNASAQTGLDAGLLRQMLPMLAMLVTGYMARQQGGAAAGADGPGSLGGLGGLAGAAGGGGLGGLLGGLLGGGQAAGGGGVAGGLGALLDANGDGNPLDDILGMVGKAMR